MEIVVAGAGVIGLAVARELARVGGGGDLRLAQSSPPRFECSLPARGRLEPLSA